MPSGITVQNGSLDQHAYRVFDTGDNEAVVFAGNVDPGAKSTAFNLAAGPNGKGSARVEPSGMVAKVFFSVGDNDVLAMD